MAIKKGYQINDSPSLFLERKQNEMKMSKTFHSGIIYNSHQIIIFILECKGIANN